jgi:hypothetical protein
MAAELVVVHRDAIDAEDAERAGQPLVQEEVVERRQELAAGEIAGAAKDDETGERGERCCCMAGSPDGR